MCPAASGVGKVCEAALPADSCCLHLGLALLAVAYSCSVSCLALSTVLPTQPCNALRGPQSIARLGQRRAMYTCPEPSWQFTRHCCSANQCSFVLHAML